MMRQDAHRREARIARTALVFAVVCVLFSGEAQAQALPPDAIARFHINNANYMMDVGKYLESLEELQTAFNFSQGAAIKAEAASLKGFLLTSFFDNPTAAAAEYDGIVQNFPGTAFYPQALFQAGILRYQTGNLAQAQTQLARYMKEFPNGAQATTAEFILDRIKAGAKPDAPAVQQKPGRLIKVALEDSTASVTITGTGLTRDGSSAPATLTISSRDITGPTSKIASSTGQLTLAGRVYRGAILLVPKKASLLVINEVSVEEYLYSVVASEAIPSWPMESLKAQAVAARTYAFYNILHPRSPGEFDLYDDTRSQAYGGIAKEHPRVVQAVNETKDQVLLDKGKPILAYFTSNNGGGMADPTCLFGTGFSYLKPLPDTYSAKEPPLGKWTRTFTLAALESALSQAGYATPGIKAISASKTCEVGRIVEIRIEYQGGELKLNTRTQFRRAVNDFIKPSQNPENMPEILMAISIKDGKIEIAGGGWGHGVGMSQYGAKAMADAGKTYAAILGTYYVGAELKTMD